MVLTAAKLLLVVITGIGFAVIERSSIAKPGLLAPTLDHLNIISLPVATDTGKIADIVVLFAVLLPSNAAPLLVCKEVKSKLLKGNQVPDVIDVTVVPV